MDLFHFVLFVKLLGVLGYAGGLLSAFVASEPLERWRAVHIVASPSLLLVWVAGYLLAGARGVPLTELWLLGGLVLSLVSLLALIHSVTRGARTPSAFGAAALPLAVVVALMVFRPTWGELRAP